MTDGFHESDTDARLQRWVDGVLTGDDYRAWVVRDGGRIVGNLGVFVTDLSLPGGARIGNAAVTAVGVAQTHRRRGLLRALMASCLDEAAASGEPVATLYASEASIYGRFGFGGASPSLRYRIDRRVGFRTPADLRLVEPIDPTGAVASFPPILEAVRDDRACVGMVATMWGHRYGDDDPADRDGASPLRMVTVPGRGYAVYRVKGTWGADNLPTGTVHVRDVVATDPEAEAALWQHVCDIDLTTTIEVALRPPDDPLQEMVLEPTRLRAALDSPVYARLLDVATALSARRYHGPGRCTFRVEDAFRDQTGTYRLEVDDDGVGVCQPVGDRDPQLELGIEDLGAVWLGGVRNTQLVGARRVVERTAGAAAAFDRLLATDRAPWTPFLF